ncbi:MAG: hypothetical protein IT479_13420 [Xanthomonadales bacterium]|nr:hypothetical protein [Xanthomonadales bacterium]MCC6594257.1 hypothetical protein [Xanthomonadales bacterium]
MAKKSELPADKRAETVLSLLRKEERPKVISRGTLSAGQLVRLVSSRVRSGAANP